MSPQNIGRLPRLRTQSKTFKRNPRYSSGSEISNVSSHPTLTSGEEKFGRSSSKSPSTSSRLFGFAGSSVVGNFFTVPHGVTAPPFGNFASALYSGCTSHRSMWPNEFWFATSSIPCICA